MTPPDPNIKKQERRHRPVFYLLALAVVVFVIGGLLFMRAPVVPDADVDGVPELGDD